MRYIAMTVLVAVSGCSSGDAVSRAEIEALRGELGALQSELAEVRAQLGAALLGLEMRSGARAEEIEAAIAEMKAGGVGKVPHLVVKATGEDLGPFIGWGSAYSAELGAYYRITGRALVVYTGAGCTGDELAYAGGGIPKGTHLVTSLGTIGTTSEEPAGVAFKSFFEEGTCYDYRNPETMDAFKFINTGIAARTYTSRDLEVRLH
jgi:hypothetical protein